MRITTIVGARPQFVKAAVVSRALAASGHAERLIHTGQHYDHELSGAFFEDLELAPPVEDLDVRSGPHGVQTAAMLSGIERSLAVDRPDAVLIYGDTNSTLAGALAAAKLRLPLAHVESGLRSGRRDMPEEINRIVADHVSDLLLAPTATAMENLAAEGLAGRSYLVGDVMFDAVRHFAALAGERSTILARLDLRPRGFGLVTIHRAENTDDPARLRGLVEALAGIDAPLVFPVHPRTREALRVTGIALPPNVRAIGPVGYFDMIELERSARAVLTDSGGVQKEAFMLATPCITLRDETEWVETVSAGWNVVAGADSRRIVEAWRRERPREEPRPVFGDGHAAERIVEHVGELHAP